MPLLVKPDNEHKPPIPQQRSSKSKRGFSKKVDSISNKDNKIGSSSLFPCELGEDTTRKLNLLSNELVKTWGDRTLTILELDDKIATAAEKAPTEDKLIQSLRKALADVKNEYEKEKNKK